MDKELLRDLLGVNCEIFDAVLHRAWQQAHEDIDDALREASIFATNLEDEDPMMTFEEVCEAAKKRARKRIRQIRDTTRVHIQKLKQEHHRRQESIRAFCEDRTEIKHTNRLSSLHAPTNRETPEGRDVRPNLDSHESSPPSDGT